MRVMVLCLTCTVTAVLRGVIMDRDQIEEILTECGLKDNLDLFKDILKNMTRISIEWGGIFRCYIPPVRPAVIVTDPALIHILSTSEKLLTKSSYYKFLKTWLGRGLVTAEVNIWRPNRRMLTPCFGRLSLMMNFLRIFEQRGDELVESFKQEIDNTSIDIFPFLKMFAMNVMCEATLGTSTNIESNYKYEYFNCLKELQQIVMHRTFSIFKHDFFYQFTDEFKMERHARKRMENFFDLILNEKIEAGNEVEIDDNSRHSFLDMLLECQTKNNLSKEYIREEINTFLFAGHDTTATGLAFTLYALARNQDIQDKVLAEQIEIFGFEVDHEVSYTELQQMKYLENVINESLRMYPPVPLVARKVTEKIEIGRGMFLPKDHSVGFFIYGCHHNPVYFPEPEKFIPERFQTDISTYSFIPFSDGPRNCLGKKFALLQLKSCISKMVRNFKLMPPKPDYQIELVPELTLTAKNGIRISLEKRNYLEE